MKSNIPVWQMVKEAVNSIGRKCRHYEIKSYIREKYGNVNEGTINCQIVICTVNHPSRVHYPENSKPRTANDTRYDFLFTTGRGEVVLYSKEQHGLWEIKRNEHGKLEVGQVVEDEDIDIIDSNADELDSTEDFSGNDTNSFFFALESHLRDFLIRNISSIKIDNKSLSIFKDKEGREGVEYPTGVGIIDLLAKDEDDNFVVFELKLSKGTDKAVGQLLRYTGWVKKHMAEGKKVKGVIVAESIDEKLKYAIHSLDHVKAFEYQLSFSFNEIGNLE